MPTFSADLHIHSLHSIGVSKSMTIPELSRNAVLKGLNIIGTGDATQPDWLNHLKRNLAEVDGIFTHGQVSFILTSEIEDNESIHHVILLPDFSSVEGLRRALEQYSPNLHDTWGGRPRVNITGEQLAGLVRDEGGLIGPAHAFTPFRSIFRENKYTNLESCYGAETAHVHFLELGLSADSTIADFIPSLRRLTYITSSDAHSPTPNKLGREFVRFKMEAPTFDELRLAILRERERKPILNVGLDPRLGKYYLSFCSSCRRTLVIEDGDASPSFDDTNIYISVRGNEARHRLLSSIHRRLIKCPADGKPLRLGVRDRAATMGEAVSKSPPHRPPYLRIAPLLDVITYSLGVKSASSKRARSLYNSMVDRMGCETDILTKVPVERIRGADRRVAQMIEAYRLGTVKYIAGGGGRYGRLVPPWEA
jgi:uncharacterized protein (TIGR00375 family)